jgi:hypothetical protein
MRKSAGWTLSVLNNPDAGQKRCEKGYRGSVAHSFKDAVSCLAFSTMDLARFWTVGEDKGLVGLRLTGPWGSWGCRLWEAWPLGQGHVSGHL